LFWIPISNPWFEQGIPIYGFGLMLFLTFITCTWLASRRAVKEGVDPKYIQDLAIWVFVGGIVVARLTYLIWVEGIPLSQPGEYFKQFFRIWQGGLVFYGSAVGGVLGAAGYFYLMRKRGLNPRQIGDIVAPTVAWGLMLGRVGCLLNGCCYGHVACTDANCSLAHFPPSLQFPVHSPPWITLVAGGTQSAAGFTMDDQALDQRTVGIVDPQSPAAAADLKTGDIIVAANGQSIQRYEDLAYYMERGWPRGEHDLTLTVQRAGQEVQLQPFTPHTLGLHPTQLYETISMFLLFLLLNAYYPFRRHYGEVFVLLIVCYAIHRFINEILRNDTEKVFGTGMTLSMNGSLLFGTLGIILFIWLWRRPPDPALVVSEPTKESPVPAGAA
jgi:phosphatidylglycerol:prolipoprotein diacylglycerol transferase